MRTRERALQNLVDNIVWNDEIIQQTNENRSALSHDPSAYLSPGTYSPVGRGVSPKLAVDESAVKSPLGRESTSPFSGAVVPIKLSVQSRDCSWIGLGRSLPHKT